MHAVEDVSLVERIHKKKKSKHKHIINSFTNEVELVNNYIINKDSGDVTEIKKHKKKRRNIDGNGNKASLTQNEIETVVEKRKRSHSLELNKLDSKKQMKLLNNIKVEGGFSVSNKQMKHHSSGTPHHFDVNQTYSNRSDLGFKANSCIIKKEKFKQRSEYGTNDYLSISNCNREDESMGVKKKKKKCHKDLDHGSSTNLLSNTSWKMESLPTKHCNVNDGVKQKKKKRHKDLDTMSFETRVDYIRIQPPIDKHNKFEGGGSSRNLSTNAYWENESLSTKYSAKKKKRLKDGSIANETETHQESSLNESCDIDEVIKKEKKKRHKEPVKQIGSNVTKFLTEPNKNKEHIDVSESEHHKYFSSSNEIYDTNNQHHKKKRKKKHETDMITVKSGVGQHKYFSGDKEILSTENYNVNDHNRKRKKKHLSCGEEVSSSEHCDISTQHHDKKRKRKHHKDAVTDESESTLSNETGEIEKKKTKRKRQEEHIIDAVKTEPIDEIENQISLTDFVLNETPQDIVSEKPAELGNVGDKKRHGLEEMPDALVTSVLRLLESTAADCVDRTIDREQSNTTDTDVKDWSIASTDHGAKNDQNEGEKSQSVCENASTVQSFKADNQTTTEASNLNITSTSDLNQGEDESDQSSEIPSPKKRRDNNETQSSDLKGVDFVNEFLDRPSVRTKLTEDNRELLEQLHVFIPFDVAPSHLVETRMSSYPTKKQQQRFKLLGLKMDVTHYSRVEDNIIRSNWENFCKVHDLPNDPTPFMCFEACTDTKVHGSVLSKQERIKFVQFLGQKLDNRYLYGIYRRFKKLFEVFKKGRFNKMEDDLIWDYVKQSNDTNHFSKLAHVLNRDRHRILMRYKVLKAQREPGAKEK